MMIFPENNFPDACFILDEDGQVIAVNTAGERLLQLEKAELLGKSLYEICSSRSLILSPEGSYPNGHSTEGPYLPDGSFVAAEIGLSSLRGSEGEHLGRLMILRAMLSGVRSQALLDRNEILLALQETTFDLHSSLDLNVVLHNIVARACKLLGTTHGYLAILRGTKRMEPVVGFDALEKALNAKVRIGKGLVGIVWKTGRPLFIPNFDQWSGRQVDFPHGLVRAILGMPLLFNQQVVGVIEVARGLESAVSFSEEDINMLRRFADLAVLALQNARLFEQAQAEIAFRRQTEIDLRNANQLLQFQIERVELLQGQLHELAVRDTLTNLFNRRYLQEMLGVEFARARRAKNPLAILMLDCDHLKNINDRFGHKAGDDSLVHIAEVIRESIRAGDIACRYGGDEFVVILNSVSEKTALERAENLRKRIAAEPIACGEEKVNIHISAGISMFPEHGAEVELLLQCADLALYAAKRRGKNRVLVYGDTLD